MARIAVFDSGLGSLSVIKEIQKVAKSEIIYFGDQKNFPYGKKSQKELERIINSTIKILKERFSPELIVVASNTPTLMLNVESKNVVGVKPPVKEAIKISKTKNIAVLSTESAIKSQSFKKFLDGFDIKTKIHKINGSNLVELVESGKFLEQKLICRKIIKKSLEKIIIENNIDVITLSSTHLPFLRKLLEKEFPSVTFIDPSHMVAKKVLQKIRKQERKNSLKIYCSGNVEEFQTNLRKLGIRNRVSFLSI